MSQRKINIICESETVEGIKQQLDVFGKKNIGRITIRAKNLILKDGDQGRLRDLGYNVKIITAVDEYIINQFPVDDENKDAERNIPGLTIIKKRIAEGEYLKTSGTFLIVAMIAGNVEIESGSIIIRARPHVGMFIMNGFDITEKIKSIIVNERTTEDFLYIEKAEEGIIYELL